MTWKTGDADEFLEDIMNEWVVIVDMDQPGNRMAVAMSADDGYSCATFGTVESIRNLQRKHPLGVFTWWAFNFVTGEAEEIWR